MVIAIRYSPFFSGFGLTNSQCQVFWGEGHLRNVPQHATRDSGDWHLNPTMGMSIQGAPVVSVAL